MSTKLNAMLNDEVSHSPSTVALSSERTKPPAQAMNLQAAVAQKLPKLRKTVTKIMASLALSSVFALFPMVAQARPFMTWNLNGATNGGQQSWENVFNTMNDSGRTPLLANGQRQPIDIAAIQEAGRLDGLAGLTQIPDSLGGTIQSNGGTIKVFQIVRDGVPFLIYWTLGDLTATTRNAIAIVVRNPTGGGAAIRPIFVPNPLGPRILGENVALDRNRPALGIRDTNGAYYFTFHAASSLNGDATNNDAHIMANAIDAAATAANSDGDAGVTSLIIGIDANRSLRNVATAFPAGQLLGGLRVIPPDLATYDARTPNPDRFLDGLIARIRDSGGGISNQTIAPGLTLNNFGTAFTPQHPSDHFAVVFEDGRTSYDEFRERERAGGPGNIIVDRVPPKNDTEPEPGPSGREQCDLSGACTLPGAP